MLDERSCGRAARVGVIGTSKRAASYVRNLGDYSGIHVAAIADPNERNRSRFERLVGGLSGLRQYDDGASMFRDELLDAVVIASPNAFHAEDAVRAMSKGIPMLLEKPVAVSVEQCVQLWREHERLAGRQVFVGFVLRYTPFYAKIKEIIDSGFLGEILSIEADENVGTYVTSVLHSGWRRNDRISGGFIVEKCCHDIDVLNWLVGAQPVRVFSMGTRSHFVPRPHNEQHPRFLAADVLRNGMDYGDTGLAATFFEAEDQSPYEVGATFPDHQSVMIEYAQGTLCTLTAVMGQPRPTRRIRIYGSDGALSGDIQESCIVLDRPDESGNRWTRSEIAIVADSSGHHGGDQAIQDAFWRTVGGVGESCARAGLKEGIDAVLVAIAAEQSRISGESVLMSPLHEQVFGP
ncbi:Gfo/Idh/MocA family oxidoreductase [Phytoactinopolyspora endophytica]|uniref:Gfo/Idh/MocA family oxidoreductase n=1 Tax=Phytoactinopolyspora endophytica TaxID=1642495 RepID=UPI00101CD437|nr:Gfo/Idh/MocA family oxidoreductase [Phytoactinopolyspora endophytica]